jgi:hypothetical protein
MEWRTSRLFLFKDPELVAPMGIGVFDNVIYVSQTPHILKYTDLNRNLVFDEGDTRRVFPDRFYRRQS